MEKRNDVIKLRKMALSDATKICDIYNYYVENTVVTFETVAVSESEMQERIREIIDSGNPAFVIEVDGKMAGYCYLHLWKERAAYTYSKEVSIYLHKDMRGKGIGGFLFDHLLKSVDSNSTHVLMAIITVPNEVSVKLHEKFGFKQVGYMKQVGRKFGEWRDVGYWELIID